MQENNQRKYTNTKHGLTNHKLYKTWKNIKYRCKNIKSEYYAEYGGRGINICDEWIDNFINFYIWAINNGYKQELSIDRINNDKGYSPDNCRWASKTTQSRNTRVLRKDNTSGFRGVTWNKKDKKWRAKIKINSKSIYIGSCNTAIEAAKAYDQYIIDNNLEHTKNF